jgi:hypothetical protein
MIGPLTARVVGGKAEMSLRPAICDIMESL